MFKFKTYVLKRMNMPFTIAFVRDSFDEILIDALNQIVYEIDKYLQNVEEKFSPFLPASLVSRHTDLGEELQDAFFDLEYQEVYSRSIIAKKETQGLFDPFYDGKYNPTGFVKGWAIENAFMKYIKPLIDNNIIESVAENILKYREYFEGFMLQKAIEEMIIIAIMEIVDMNKQAAKLEFKS